VVAKLPLSRLSHPIGEAGFWMSAIWIQGGRAPLSGGGPIRFSSTSLNGASVNLARRRGLTTHGRIPDCWAGATLTRLSPQEGLSSIGCSATCCGVSLELRPGRGGGRDQSKHPRPGLWPHGRPSTPPGRRGGAFTLPQALLRPSTPSSGTTNIDLY